MPVCSPSRVRGGQGSSEAAPHGQQGGGRCARACGEEDKVSPACTAGLGEPGCGDCRRPRLAPGFCVRECGPSQKYWFGLCTEASGDVACMGHAGTWSSGDARGWKSSRGGQAVASPAPPEAETSAATWPPDLCSSLLVTRPRVKPAGVGSTSRGRRRRAARGSHAGVLPGRLGVRGDLSAHSRQARSPWTRCGGRAGGGSGRLVPHPRLAQLPGVWAAAHCSRCPRRHRSRGSPSASHVPDRCA